MTTEELLAFARAQERKINRLKRNPRVRGVMAFLIRKGLLISNYDYGKAPRTITAQDCIFTATQFEPRVFAVVPAVLIHFPKAIENPRKLPKVILDAVQAIRTNKSCDANIQGINFKEMDFFARTKLLDRRVRPIGQKKIVRTFRLSPRVVAKLEELAKASNISVTEVLERSVTRF